MAETVSSLLFLQGCTLTELRELAKTLKCTFHAKHSKEELIDAIKISYHQLKRFINYTYVSQLTDGSEARVFLAKEDRTSKLVVIKIFHDSVSIAKIQQEIDCHQKAAESGIAPTLIESDAMGRYLVVQKMDKTLFEHCRENGGRMKSEWWPPILDLFKRMDEIGLLHGDPNPGNIIETNMVWKMIDFGHSRTSKKTLPIQDNQKQMTLGLYIYLKESFPKAKYPELKKTLQEIKTI